MRRLLLLATTALWLHAAPVAAQYAATGPSLSASAPYAGNITNATVQVSGGTATALGKTLYFSWQGMGAIPDPACLPAGTSTNTLLDNGTAFASMASKAATDWAASGTHDVFVDTQGGCYQASTGINFAQGVSAKVFGAGQDSTYIIRNGLWSGDTISFSGAFGGTQIVNTNSNVGTITTYGSGPEVGSLTIMGNLTMPGNGVVYYDFDDQIKNHQLELDYINGLPLGCGLYKNTTQGVCRESTEFANDVTINVSGQSATNTQTSVGTFTGTLTQTGTAAPEILVATTCNGTAACASGSASNAIRVENTRGYAFMTDGFGTVNQNTNQGIHDIWVAASHFEGLATGFSQGHDIHLGSPANTGLADSYMHIDSDQANVPSPGECAIAVDGPSNYSTLAQAPFAIGIHGLQVKKGGIASSTQDGICIFYGGRAITIDTDYVSVAGTNLLLSASVAGTITLDGGFDECSWTESNSAGTNHLTKTGHIMGAFTAGDLTFYSDTCGSMQDSGIGTATTGTGSLVRSVSPTLTTPTLGAAVATSVTASGNGSFGTLNAGATTITTLNSTGAGTIVGALTVNSLSNGGTSSLTGSIVTDVTLNKHLVSTIGTQPTIACSGGTGACTLDANATDVKGMITTGTLSTSATLTFNAAFGIAPVCIVESPGAVAVTSYAAVASKLTINFGATTAGVFDYFCIK
jgi:hypothetical protein